MASGRASVRVALYTFIGLATASADIKGCLDDTDSLLQTGVALRATQLNSTDDPMDALFSWSDMWEMSIMPTASALRPKEKIGGWNLAAAVQIGTSFEKSSGLDGVQLWQHEGGVCALAWGTSDSLLEDCLHEHSNNDLEDHHFTECGLDGLSFCQVHELHKLVLHADWAGKVVPYIKENCTTGLVTEGYSLGGWLASVYAICANHLVAASKSSMTLEQHVANRTVVPVNGTVDDVNRLPGGLALIPGPVDAIYSMGAPSVNVHKEQLVNPLSPDGWFRGKRIFIQAPDGIDPIVIPAEEHHLSPLPEGVEVGVSYHPYMQSYKLSLTWPFFLPKVGVELAEKDEVMTAPLIETQEFNFLVSPLIFPFNMLSHLKYGPYQCMMDKSYFNVMTVVWCVFSHNAYTR